MIAPEVEVCLNTGALFTLITIYTVVVVNPPKVSTASTWTGWAYTPSPLSTVL